MTKLSIIVPFYNVENYIVRCINSLLNQTLEDIEIIFINDGSTDHSLAVLNETLKQYDTTTKKIKIINNPKNVGAAASRNIGLNNAVGKYIGWTDADDYIELEMFEKLIESAENIDADLTWCDFYDVRNNKTIIKHQNSEENNVALSQDIIKGKVYGILCNKIIKRDLFNENQIRFLDGNNLTEDRTVLLKILYYCKKINHVRLPFYYYVHQNSESITTKISMNNVYEQICNTKEIIEFYKKNDVNWFEKIDYDKFKFRAKHNLLYSKSITDFEMWLKTFPESNYYYLKSDVLSVKHKVLAFFVKNEYWIFIKFWIYLKKLKN